MTNHNQHKEEIKRACEKFRKNVKAIEESENPYYHDPQVRAFEIKALRSELSATVAEQSNAFNALIEAQIAEAEKAAQHSHFIATETQRKQVDFAVDEFVSDTVLAYDDNGKHSAYNALERRLDGMGPEELTHLRLQLPSILQRVSNDPIAVKKLRSLNDTLAQLKTPAQENLDELRRQKVSGADGAFKRLKVTHQAFVDQRDNLNR